MESKKDDRPDYNITPNVKHQADSKILLIILVPIISIGMLVYSYVWEIQQKDLLLESKVELIESQRLEIEAKDEKIKAQNELIEILKKK